MNTYSFGSFTTLPSNAEAVSTCRLFTNQQELGSGVNSILCLCGAIGCGTTYLLKSIQSSVAGAASAGTVRFMQAEELVIDLIASVGDRREKEAFKETYTLIDLLIIDNFEYLKTRPTTYGMIMEHLAETLLEGQKYVIGCSDDSDFSLILTTDLRSICEDVRIVHILTPDQSEMVNLLEEKFRCRLNYEPHIAKMWEISRSAEGDISKALASAESYFFKVSHN